jgi:hypothetical protein
MKIKGTFLSYISEEKRLRKEQNRALRAASKSKKILLEEPAIVQVENGGTALQLQ